MLPWTPVGPIRPEQPAQTNGSHSCQVYPDEKQMSVNGFPPTIRLVQSPRWVARRGWQTMCLGFVVCLPSQTIHFPIVAPKCRAHSTPHWEWPFSFRLLFVAFGAPPGLGHWCPSRGATGTTVNFTDDPPDPLNLLSGRPPDRPNLGSSRGRATAEPGSSHCRAHGIWGVSRVKPLFWERVWERFGTIT